jgi:hypothetical protein
MEEIICVGEDCSVGSEDGNCSLEDGVLGEGGLGHGGMVEMRGIFF